jgi:hypothetical protein
MATVWLLRDDCEAGTLPGLCLVCGKMATGRVEKDFRGTLIWLDPLKALSAPSVKVRVPVCNDHRHHWRNRSRIAFWTLVLASLLAAPLLAFFLFVHLPEKEDPRLLHLFMLCTLALVLIGMWSCFTLIALSLTGIRAWRIREQGIQLTNVSAKFLEAYEFQRWRGAAAYRAAAALWKEGAGSRPADEERFRGEAGYEGRP